jgi:hypothetical protein
MAYPLPPTVAFVTAQPKQYDINCNFGMFLGERLLYHTKMNTGCCKIACCGNIFYTSVTDARFIERREQCICCGCCCKRPTLDTCIYFRDISELRETREGICCCQTCCELSFRLCPELCWCRCMLPKRLQLRGTFLTHTIHIYSPDLPDFELMITEAIAQHKLLNQH